MQSPGCDASSSDSDDDWISRDAKEITKLSPRGSNNVRRWSTNECNTYHISFIDDFYVKKLVVLFFET